MLFLNLGAWFLQNTETGQILKGDFPPVNYTRSRSNSYARHTSISRTNAIMQFLHGEAQKLSVDIRLFGRDIAFNSVERDLVLMESWMMPQSGLNDIPPVMTFWVGDAHVIMDCVIISMANIRYGTPDIKGGVRDVSLTLELEEYVKFDINDNRLFETRYHRARQRDYYEMLTFREYGDPMMGDIIRKRHPTKPVINVGDTIKLPSIAAVRRDVVEPKSITFKGAFAKKDSPQKTLRATMFDLRARPYVSHILVE